VVVRALLVLGGIVAEWFIATDSPNFSVMRGIMAIFVLAAIIGVISLWPRRGRRDAMRLSLSFAYRANDKPGDK
jgi:membrane protein DedA with SNARE-associated domain